MIAVTISLDRLLHLIMSADGVTKEEICEYIREFAEGQEETPTVVCLCGSTRFKDAFDDANYQFSIEGKIVLSVGFFMHASGNQHGGHIGCTPEQKQALDILHLRKIDLADEVFVLNKDKYIGESTRNEIRYALKKNKPVTFLEPDETMLQLLRDEAFETQNYMEP